jgi:hypothetical protein
MADRRAPEREPSPAAFLLDFLVGKHPALFSIDELDRMLASPEEDSSRSGSCWRKPSRSWSATGSLTDSARSSLPATPASVPPACCKRGGLGPKAPRTRWNCALCVRLAITNEEGQGNSLTHHNFTLETDLAGSSMDERLELALLVAQDTFGSSPRCRWASP